MAGGDHLGLHLGEGIVDLGANFCAHAGQAKEVTVENAAGVSEELEEGAEETAAFQLPQGAAGPSEEEEKEDDVADSVVTLVLLVKVCGQRCIA